MDDERRAKWIRWLTLLLIVGGGVLAGFFIEIPAIKGFGSGAEEESALEQVDPENFREKISAEHKLTVINMMKDGNPDAEKLQAILDQLEEENTFGKRVAYAELDVDEHGKLAAAQKVDLEDFTGQLDFYAAGYHLGTLKGPAERPKVEETIKRYLAGLVKRFGPGWLPDVEGLQRAGKDDEILHVQPADPVVPGMQRSSGGLVPGMQRAKEPTTPGSAKEKP